MSTRTQLLSSRHPVLYHLAVSYHRLKRRTRWIGVPFASEKSSVPLPFRVKKHQSVLIRKLGDTDVQLQINKVTNLNLAIPHLTGILIKPGEVFSFCKLVGEPTAAKGYLPGMELHNGIARPGIGGGLCQIANLIHWLVMHSPLTIIERHHHSFDPFPDDGRVLPFGSGATIFYNYKDYQFKNETDRTYQLFFWTDEKCLNGDLRCEADSEFAYHVFEKDHAFFEKDGQYYRKNEIWRNKILKYQSGEIVSSELLARNYARTAYVPECFQMNSPQS